MAAGCGRVAGAPAMLNEYPVTRIISQLESDTLLPAILFRTSRKQCDADITRLARSRHGAIHSDHQRALRGEIQKVIDEYGVDPEVILTHPQYGALTMTAVGAHHAGQLLVWRLLLEELMSRGLLRLMIATGTVAAGVDFPARTVVITAHSKRGAEGFNTLSASELQQMSGRAGRRGKDKVGICLVAPGPFADARVINEVAKRPAEPLRSAYFASPSTVLNLLKFRNVDDLKFTVEKSLAAFLDRRQADRLREECRLDEEAAKKANMKAEGLKRAEKRIRRKLRDADELEGRQRLQLLRTLEGLANLGYIDEQGQLTEKGIWGAGLCTSIGLELGEAIADFLLSSDSSEYELVGLIGSIAGDAHRTYLSIRENPVKKEQYQQLAEIINRVKGAFVSPFNPDLEVSPEAGLTVVTWLEAQDWIEFAGLLRLSGVSDGDAARLIMQTADHFGQISRLYETHTELARKAADIRRRLLKPPLSETMLVE